MLVNQDTPLATAAAKAGMDETTARKYRRVGKLPSEVRRPHEWRTRPDPFVAVWDEVQGKLEVTPGLQAQTLLADLQRRYPGRFQDGRCGRCNGGSSAGGRWPGRRKKCFSSSGTSPAR